MKLTKIDSYEIQAFAFRVMTGYVAPGKDASPLADEASYEERCAAFDEWRNEHAPCILAMLHGFEALIDRNDEPTRALLDRLDKAERENERLRAERDEHARWREKLADDLHERESQIIDGWAALRDSGVQSEKNIADGIKLLRAENEALAADARRYRWLRGREDGRYMTVYAFRTDVDEVCLGEELDATIDAAMAAEKGQE